MQGNGKLTLPGGLMAEVKEPSFDTQQILQMLQRMLAAFSQNQAVIILELQRIHGDVDPNLAMMLQRNPDGSLREEMVNGNHGD